jgi:CheY-like chemotaxis protein
MGTLVSISMTRVVIVDDQPEFRHFAREMLENDISLTVVGRPGRRRPPSSW